MKDFTRRHMLTIEGGAPGGGSAPAAPPAAAPGGSAAPPTPQAPAASYDWKANGFDDNAVNYITTKGWKSPTDLHQSYVNLEKLTGVGPDKLIKLPTNDDPNAWNEVYTKLGRPADAKGYQLPVPEGDNGEFAKTAAGWFHEAGLPQSMANKLTEKWNAHNATTMQAEQARIQQTQAAEVESLKVAWGANYQANEAIVQRAAETFGMNQQQLEALRNTMGPKAAMEFMHKIGSKIGVDDKFVNGNTPPNGFQTLTPEQAQAKIQANSRDRAFAERFSSKDPKVRQEAREESNRLHLIAFPGA